MIYIRRLHPITWFFLAVLINTQTHRVVANELQLPDMGNTADYAVSPIEEKKTGEAVIRNIRRGGGVVDDPLIEGYLDHLGYRLISNSSHTEQDFKFFLINDKALNAFALPGGFIGINYGLILTADREGELASVMAHEVAHITQRHHVRAFEHGHSQGPILAALIAAMILGAGNSEIGEAAFAATAAGMMESNINFTRSNEKEADYIGITMLANAGYDPMEMASFFSRLDKASRLYGSTVPEFLRSHPFSANRMADAQSRARSLKQKKKTFDKLSFHLIQARIRALSHENPNQAVSEFEKRITSKSYKNRIAEQYGYALSLIKSGQLNKANIILNRLLKNDPNRIAYLVAKGELENSGKKITKSQSTYTKALELYPDNKVIIYYYAQNLLKNRQFSKARSLLNKVLKTPDNLPQLYKFLSEAESGLGNASGVHHAMAEYYFYQGQAHEAIRQMQLAMKADNKSDFYTTARREARLVEYQKEIITKLD
ncbi:MAG: M48 family metalloprotease [Gammaproteobacteria bacterium]|nr:M48 family metalloprotease [Gammaproteobacteria bacterium]